jgi:hypothetical protein
VQGQNKIRLRGTDDVLIVGLHMVGKKVEVSSLLTPKFGKEYDLWVRFEKESI